MAGYLEGMTVYLAHPIDFAGPEGGAWTKTRQQLVNMGGLVFDPARAFGLPDVGPHGGVLAVCRKAIEACDFMVAVSPEKPGVGTAMELEFARSLGKPIVVVSENWERSWALAGTGAKMTTEWDLDAADWVLKAINGRALAGTPWADPNHDVIGDLQKARVQLTPEPGVDLRFTHEGATEPVDDGAGIIWANDDLNGNGRQPTRGYPGDAGFDLYVSEGILISPDKTVDVPCGIRLALPDGFFGLVIGRSSTMRTHKLQVQINVIDTGYRGPMFVQVTNHGKKPFIAETGMRLAQIVPIANAADSMPDPIRWHPDDFDSLATDRGTAGFGSSGA